MTYARKGTVKSKYMYAHRISDSLVYSTHTDGSEQNRLSL